MITGHVHTITTFFVQYNDDTCIYNDYILCIYCIYMTCNYCTYMYVHVMT